MNNNKKTNRKFIKSILPESGHFCVFELPSVANNKNGKPKWFDNNNDVFKYIKDNANANDSKEFCIALATFKKQGVKHPRRKQEYAESLRVFFLDIDCGPGKPYATQKEGKKALRAFCEKTKLPRPALVDSGNGLHVYWKLTDKIDANTWKQGASKLRKLVLAIEPGLDKDVIVTDSSRVLRSVGTFNKKDLANHKEVTLIKDCKARDYTFIEERLDSALASLLTPQIFANDQVIDSKQRENITSALAEKIADNCPVIKLMKEKKGRVTELLWYACIGVLRHCDESPEIIHEWSSGYSGYTKAETDAKISQHKLPPTTCQHFEKIKPEICKKCKHYGLIKSPISLGLIGSGDGHVPEYVKELNQYHFVMPLNGRTRVWREYYNYDLGWKMIESFSFADFKNLYSNKNVQFGSDGDGEFRKSKGDLWLKHPKRREYNDMAMLPEGTPDGIYNLWSGFSVEPAEGQWDLMKKHIKHVICNSDMKAYRYAIGWLARMFQQPGEVGEVALVLQGEKGVGKGMFVNVLCKIMGQHSLQITNSQHMTGNFNAHLHNCILLHADEAFWAGNKKGEGVLKGLVTERVIAIERKGFDVKQVKNVLHIIMSSNDDWVVPASADERRYCVLQVSNKYKQNEKYFKKLAKEIENGGAASMLYYLLNLDISNFNVRTAPVTTGLIEQKLRSLDAEGSWWYQKLKDGELIQGGGWGYVSVQELYDEYLASNQKIRVGSWQADKSEFGKKLHKMLPEGWPKKSRVSLKNGSRTHVYEFPSLKICRKYFSKRMGTDSIKW